MSFYENCAVQGYCIIEEHSSQLLFAVEASNHTCHLMFVLVSGSSVAWSTL
jgi:hypothetical protein